MTAEAKRLERVLGLSALGLLLLGCLVVLRPFITSLLWAVILSFSTWPLYRRLASLLGGRRLFAPFAMTLLIALVLLLPFVVAGFALAEDVKALAGATLAWIQEGPPGPPEWVRSIPLAGDPVADYWAELVADSARLRQTLAGCVEPVSKWLLSIGANLGRGLIELGLSVLIVFFLSRDGLGAGERLEAVVDRLAGSRGRLLLDAARRTARGVGSGILGTALVQAAVAGVGVLIAGVPGPFLLALLTFFFSAVIPFGPPLVWVPAAIWLFHRGAAGWGLFMLVWGIGVSSVDNFVRPLLICQGTDLPFLFVFLGVLGGMLAFGFIGVFIGPTLLAVGYRLLKEWAAVSAGGARPAES